MTKRALLYAVFTIALTAISLESLVKADQKRIALPDDPLYLPNGTALGFLSLGFQNALSDLLWFQTLSYFGKHYRSDQNYKWLGNMCNVVASLDPKKEFVYKFCAVMLAWEANDVEAANNLLAKAIEHSPQSWYYLYLRGFNFLFFKKDISAAKADLIEASSKPGVHPLVTELAAKLVSKEFHGDIFIAVSTLQGLINSTSDPSIKAMLTKKLQQLSTSRSPGSQEKGMQ